MGAAEINISLGLHCINNIFTALPCHQLPTVPCTALHCRSAVWMAFTEWWPAEKMRFRQAGKSRQAIWSWQQWQHVPFICDIDVQYIKKQMRPREQECLTIVSFCGLFFLLLPPAEIILFSCWVGCSHNKSQHLLICNHFFSPSAKSVPCPIILQRKPMSQSEVPVGLRDSMRDCDIERIYSEDTLMRLFYLTVGKIETAQRWFRHLDLSVSIVLTSTYSPK